MILLVESAPAEKKLFRRKQLILINNSIMLGMRVTVMTIPLAERLRTGQRERLKKRLTAVMGKLRINTVCLKNDFPYPEWFEGYRRPDGSAFIKRLMGKIAVMAADRHESVYVYMKRADRWNIRALAELCEGFRFVSLSAQNGESGQISASLMKSCGASVMTEPTAERIKTADAAVFFDIPDEKPVLNESCVSLCVRNTDAEFRMTDGSEIGIPDGYSQKSLISEAVLRGCIRFEDIQISRIKISP